MLKKILNSVIKTVLIVLLVSAIAGTLFQINRNIIYRFKISSAWYYILNYRWKDDFRLSCVFFLITCVIYFIVTVNKTLPFWKLHIVAEIIAFVSYLSIFIVPGYSTGLNSYLGLSSLFILLTSALLIPLLNKLFIVL